MLHHCGKGLLGCVVWLLTSIGAISWGLVYFKGLNLIDYIAGMFPIASVATVTSVLYGIIAVAGVLSLLFWAKCLFNRHEECATDRR